MAVESSAVESRAVEVERISENRRFIAKLLADEHGIAEVALDSELAMASIIVLDIEDRLRAITTATAGSVLSLDRKSLDNLLARAGSGPLSAGRQGVERRIPVTVLEEIALTVELNVHLGVPRQDAFELARALLGRHAMRRGAGAAEEASDFVGSITLGQFLHVGIDVRAFRADLQAKLEQAIESHVRPRRGRPRKPRPASQPVADV